MDRFSSDTCDRIRGHAMQFDVKYAYFNFLEPMPRPSIDKTQSDDLSKETA